MDGLQGVEPIGYVAEKVRLGLRACSGTEHVANLDQQRFGEYERLKGGRQQFGALVVVVVATIAHRHDDACRRSRCLTRTVAQFAASDVFHTTTEIRLTVEHAYSPESSKPPARRAGLGEALKQVDGIRHAVVWHRVQQSVRIRAGGLVIPGLRRTHAISLVLARTARSH
jgi:hypothetical protein